jgi:hypothetical protein
VLDDASLHFGTLQAGKPGHVRIVTNGGPIEVQTHRVVRLHRLKRNLWASLDGDIAVSYGFTQQNAKSDLGFGGSIRYPHQSNLTQINFDIMFSSQNEIADTFRLNGALAHFRQFAHRWFYLGIVSGARNSQLSLDSRVSVGGGAGYAMVESNRTSLAVWLGPSVSFEQYTNEEATTAIPLVFVTDFQLFLWEPLSTDISSRLFVAPVLNDGGRWRVDFTIQAKRELVADLNLVVGVTQIHDTRPPATDANQNDFSLTTSLEFNF